MSIPVQPHPRRKVLSQFHDEVFSYDGHSFQSAEHAWHYIKLKTVNQVEKALTFTMESESMVAMGTALHAKRAGGRRGVHSMTHEEIVVWEQSKRDKVEEMLYAKFSSSELARTVLLATGDAELLHYERGPKFVDLLSRVRRRLQEDV